MAVKSCFVFSSVFCQQVDGVATDSPLEPTLPNLFFTTYFKQKYFRCYVVEIFPMFKEKIMLKRHFSRRLHIFHKSITHAKKKIEIKSRFSVFLLPGVTTN